jgi:hypothetical protein
MMVGGFSMSALLWMSCNSIIAKPGSPDVLLSVQGEKKLLQKGKIHVMPDKNCHFSLWVQSS